MLSSGSGSPSEPAGAVDRIYQELLEAGRAAPNYGQSSLDDVVLQLSTQPANLKLVALWQEQQRSVENRWGCSACCCSTPCMSSAASPPLSWQKACTVMSPRSGGTWSSSWRPIW